MPNFRDVTSEVVQRLNRNLPKGPAGQPDRLANDIKPLTRFDPANKDPVPLYDAATDSWLTGLGPNRVAGFLAKRRLDPTTIAAKLESELIDRLGLFPFPTEGLQPQVETLVLDHGAGAEPRLFAVCYPRNFAAKVKEMGSMPFVFYFRPQLRQVIEKRFGGNLALGMGFYVGYDGLAIQPGLVPAGQRADESLYHPYGWDYLYFQIWRYLNYAKDPLKEPSFIGLIYQLAMAQKNVVLVIPILSAAQASGSLKQPAGLMAVLDELKSFLLEEKLGGLTLPGRGIGPVALAGYSSGNQLVTQLLLGLQADSPIEEIYNFDCPNADFNPAATDADRHGDRWVDAAVAWAAQKPQRTIRVYTQYQYKNLAKVLGSRPFATDSPVLSKSADGRRSVAHLGEKAWSAMVGPIVMSGATDAELAQLGLPANVIEPVIVGKAYLKALAAGSKLSDETLRHQMFGSMMFTDALRRSRFKR